MLRTLALAAAFALAASASFAAPGDGGGPPYTLDAKGKCHGAKTFANADMCKAASTGKKPPNCTKGKLCGDTCIAKDKVCHIKP
jgi:hypothetical protein